MARKISELRAKMTPAALEKAVASGKAMLDETLLHEQGRARALSREQKTKTLQIKQVARNT